MSSLQTSCHFVLSPYLSNDVSKTRQRNQFKIIRLNYYYLKVIFYLKEKVGTILKMICKRSRGEECIPAGCVPFAAVATGGYTPREQNDRRLKKHNLSAATLRTVKIFEQSGLKTTIWTSTIDLQLLNVQWFPIAQQVQHSKMNPHLFSSLNVFHFIDFFIQENR